MRLGPSNGSAIIAAAEGHAHHRHCVIVSKRTLQGSQPERQSTELATRLVESKRPSSAMTDPQALWLKRQFSMRSSRGTKSNTPEASL